MTGVDRPYALVALERTALAADAEEKRFRASVAEEIERREVARRRAFRRYGFLRALVEADAAAPDREASHVAQRAAAAAELEWEEIDEARKPVLDALTALADAIHDARTGALPAEEAGAATLQALEAFEAWYERARGLAFAELFDRYMPETPLVDF
ncbi:hypothetical protein [Methylopila sp. Yamaguchi]|uniref:hypothetical protein n=1 Tax=Methylopila sp. Yamaguchi TaxID=1437817 RepID=UPI000CC0A6B4|nr:hypothetical protein [Methylopila sp. Yamaguchi]GBD48938.1 hypothetical protein METY_2151 [Methylopila sp. Yamaguchi]